MSRMEASEKRRIVEALILSSPEPIAAARIAEIIPYCDAAQTKDLINELNTEYSEQDRSFEIWEVAGGFQIRTRAEFSGYLQKLQKERAMRLSPAALETLAIIAYRQPVTRAEIEEVRGVDAGATVKSLLERHLIRIAGQREVPGRPMLYGTTRRFLEVFGLERLKDLPTLRELDELAREQGLLEKTADDAVVDGILDGAAEAVGEPEETDTEETEGALASGSEEADVTDLNAVTGLVEEEAAEGDDVDDAAGAEGLISVEAEGGVDASELPVENAGDVAAAAEAAEIEAEADVATDIDDDENNDNNDNNENNNERGSAL